MKNIDVNNDSTCINNQNLYINEQNNLPKKLQEGPSSSSKWYLKFFFF